MTAVDLRIAGLTRRSIGVDAHNHYGHGRYGLESDALDAGAGLDLAGEIGRSGFAAVVMTLTDLDETGDTFARFLEGLAAMDAALRRDRLSRALSADDVRAAHARGGCAVIQAVEGPGFLDGRIERVEHAWRRGVRQLGLGWPAKAPEDGLGALTTFDLDVLADCQRLGVLVDLGDVAPQAMRLALRIATRPVIVSHTGLDTRLGQDATFARMMRPRLIARDLALEVAGGGGVIGVWPHLAASPEAYVANIRAMIDVVGVNHVCIGTDTKLTRGGRPGVWTNRVWPGQSAGFYTTVVEAMLKAKFSPAEISLVGGGNYLRVFEAATR